MHNIYKKIQFVIIKKINRNNKTKLSLLMYHSKIQYTLTVGPVPVGMDCETGVFSHRSESSLS